MGNIYKNILLGSFLILLSIITYFSHYIIFKDAHHIFIYLIGDIGFVFIEVLLVTLIIHKLLESHDKQSRLEKLNMVIGVFFGEIGTDLLVYFSNLDPNIDTIRHELIVTKEWSKTEFKKVSRHLNDYTYQVEPARVDLEKLKEFLNSKRDVLLAIMGNPNLIEHESFTELLRTVFHLAEELKYRSSVGNLPEEDISHLEGDIDRVYGKLVNEWVSYMKHLKDNFPYFFSLAMRTNPFDQKASIIVM